MADQNNIYTTNIVDGGTVVSSMKLGDTFTSNVEAGAVGQTGPTGATGPTGPANTLAIGTVTNGGAAAATITGSAPNQTLNLTLPVKVSPSFMEDTTVPPSTMFVV